MDLTITVFFFPIVLLLKEHFTFWAKQQNEVPSLEKVISIKQVLAQNFSVYHLNYFSKKVTAKVAIIVKKEVLLTTFFLVSPTERELLTFFGQV